MKKTNTKNTDATLISLLLFILPFFKGMHDTLTVIIMAAIMIVAIIIKSRKNKEFCCSFDFNFIIILIWTASYLITSFYAVDKGMAFLGALKMLSIPIFLLLYFQYDITKERKNNIFKAVSYSGVFMTILSLLLAPFPKFTTFFFASNRLQGFFNYANSFGIWLLVGVIILLFQKELTKKDIASLIILILGIVLTNSRAIIILTVLAFIISFFFTKLL